MEGDLGELAYNVSTWVVPVLLAITLHEAAHGWVAWKLGDDTAYRLGRVTFNPLAHIDRFGTVLLPALLLLASGGRLAFGYAKPVPVRFNRLRRPRRDMALVAAAGPASNIAIAIASAALVHVAYYLPEAQSDWASLTLAHSLYLNLVLAVLNMIPLPPLDGGRVAVGLLPDSLALPLSRIERHGMLILIGGLLLLPLLGDALGVDLNVFAWIIIPVVDFLASAIAGLFGLRWQ